MNLMIPTLFQRFKRLPVRFYSTGPGVRTDRFRKFKLCKSVNKTNLDKFGTQRISINGIEGNLLNDSGEALMSLHGRERRFLPPDTIQSFTPCIIRKDFVIEVADFVYTPYKGLDLVNYRIGEIPEELRQLGIDVYRNNWSFFYYDRFVSLRLIIGGKDDCWESKNSEFKKIVPRKYHHVESEDWLSKPRVKIWVKKICEQ